jgi:hypothetical protein
VKKIKSESYGMQQRTFAGGPGPGGNFYHGRDLGTHSRGSLGTRGADSNFSRRTQALVPSDYYDLLEDEEEEKFDEDVVVEDSKYSLSEATGIFEQVLDMEPDNEDLNATVEEILSDPTELARFERSLGEHAYEFTSELILRDLASGPWTLALGDEAIGALRIIINIFIQIRRSNNQMEDQEEVVEKYLEYLGKNANEINSSEDRRNKEILVIQDHISKIQVIQDDLARDLTDTLQGVIALIPDDSVGPIAATETLLGKAAETLPEILDDMEINDLSELEMIVQKDRDFKALRYTIAFLTGLKALSNFSMLLTGPAGIFITIASLLNINIFNPGKILISGVRSYFVGSMLQNRLLVAIQVLKTGRAEYYYSDNIDDLEDVVRDERSEENVSSTLGQEYSDQNISQDISDVGSSQFLRKAFFKDPGDQGMFSESLKKQSLVYLIEEKDSEIEEEEEVNEFSGAGGAAIGTLPLGMSTKGKGSEHSSTSGGKAFPYSKENRKKFKKYTRKTFGGKK